MTVADARKTGAYDFGLLILGTRVLEVVEA